MKPFWENEYNNLDTYLINKQTSMDIPYIKYIPLKNLRDQGLNSNEILIAGIIVSFNKTDNLRAGYSNIAEAIGTSPKTAQRAINNLKDKKLIIVKSGYKQRNANEYIPTKKLLALYGQNDHINMAKMTTHTPKGYNKEDTPSSLAKKEGFSKEYQEDLKAYNEEYAKQRLLQRIQIKKINI